VVLVSEVTVVEEVTVGNQHEEITETRNRHILLHEDQLGPHHTNRVGPSKLTFLEPRDHTNHLSAGRPQHLISLVLKHQWCSQYSRRAGRVDTKRLGPRQGQLTTCTSMGSWNAG